MSPSKICRLLVMLIMVGGFSLFNSQDADGAMTMRSELRGKMVNGEAWYITYGKSSSAFFATVEGAEPDAVLRISFQRGTKTGKIGTMQADGKGRARLTMYTTIPQLREEDKLEIWHGSEAVAYGFMKVVQPVVDK